MPQGAASVSRDRKKLIGEFQELVSIANILDGPVATALEELTVMLQIHD